VVIWIWVVGLALAFGAVYIGWSWKPEKRKPTPKPPLYEEKNHLEISPPIKPERFTRRIHPETNGLPRVAIVIDDLGYQKQLTLDFIELEFPLTLSFLPQAPFSKEMVQQAFQKGKETLLHLPMEPNGFPQTNPGPKTLLTNMSDEEILNILKNDLDAFPQVSGVNNHMGSRFTEDRYKIALVLSMIKERKLFFLDSRTTPQTVILFVASQLGVKAVQRDIFIDNNLNEEAIILQLEQLIRLAQERGFAVACGHPYPQTLRALKAKIPELQDKVRLVPVSQLF